MTERSGKVNEFIVLRLPLKKKTNWGAFWRQEETQKLWNTWKCYHFLLEKRLLKKNRKNWYGKKKKVNFEPRLLDGLVIPIAPMFLRLRVNEIGIFCNGSYCFRRVKEKKWKSENDFRQTLVSLISMFDHKIQTWWRLNVCYV